MNERYSVKFTVTSDCYMIDEQYDEHHSRQEYVTDNIARFHRNENGDTYVCFKLLDIKGIKE